jgi:hypothetical protein
VIQQIVPLVCISAASESEAGKQQSGYHTVTTAAEASKQAIAPSLGRSLARSRGLSFGLSAIAGVRSPPTLLGSLTKFGPLFRGLNRSWTPFLGLNKYSKDLPKCFSVKVTGITECFSLRISGKYSTLGSASIDKMKNIPP